MRNQEPLQCRNKLLLLEEKFGKCQPRPTTSEVPEELSLRELILVLGGGEWRKRLANQTKPNDRLFSDYLSIIKASKSYKWYRETERLLGQFQTFIGNFPPKTPLFTSFFQRYNIPEIRQSTRARYYYVFPAFFKWYDESSLPFKVKSPKPVPPKGKDISYLWRFTHYPEVVVRLDCI